VVGIVAIVAGHTWDQHDWVRDWFFTWHVPVFFIISGYLWKEGRTTRSELRNRTRTLLVPYVAWILLVSVVWFGFRALRSDPIDWSVVADLPLGGWHIDRPYSAFWFITALFIATVLMRWLTNISPFLPWFVGVLGVAWCTVDPVQAKVIPEAAGLALPAILFLCMGWLLRRYRHAILQPLQFGLVLLVPALLIGASPALAHFNMKSGVLGTPLVGVLLSAAISCGLILVAESLERFVRPRLGRVFTTIAEAGIPIILGHALVLSMTHLVGMPPGKKVFLLAFTIPLVFALVARMTPLRGVLTGIAK
jgi:fucose 4-O-acetylase-like acetyltransferase